MVFIAELSEDTGGVVTPEDEGDAFVGGVDAGDEFAEGTVGVVEEFHEVHDEVLVVGADVG